MIASGEKKEEYREDKTYWYERLLYWDKAFKFMQSKSFAESIPGNMSPTLYLVEHFGKEFDEICFHKGYTSTTISYKCNGITFGKGNPKWGAPDKNVFIIKIGEKIL